ncbi:hypothetical protein [Acinetobacter pittii]|uniref:hypothetical protein n=1 Tax=Acinetobacter pittii TaxID=48296 RepID=UPI00168D4C8F|nr:hypothetical protein [Acinetobacter pittii]
MLRTRILNLSKDYIYRIDRHFWIGRAVTDRTTLAAGNYAILTEQGPRHETVKYGEAWATGNESTDRKWVFAFDSDRQKAYAEAGPSGRVDWDVVEEALVKSGSKSESDDPLLGGKTVAEVDGTNAYATFR